MAGNIEILLRFTENGLELLDQTSGKISKIGDSANTAKGGLAGFASGLNDAARDAGVLGGAVTTAVALVDKVNALGTASLRAKNSLDIMSNGRATQFLNAMKESTHGLVGEMDLASQATKGLTLGVIQTADQAATLAKAGSVLGMTMGTTATQGVETLTVALSRVGQTMLLDNIGLSAKKVMDRFKELKKSMGEQDAWSTAVLEDASVKANKLGASLEGVGSSWERLKVSISDGATEIAEAWSTTLENGLKGWETTFASIDAIIDHFQAKSAAGGSQAWRIPMAPQQWHPPMAAQPQQLPNNGLWGAQPQVAPKAEGWMFQPSKESTGVHVKKDDDYMFEVINHKMGAASDVQMKAAHDLESAAAKLQAAADAERRAGSVKGAFNLNQAGIYGEVGGTMDSGMAAAREQFVKNKKRKIGTGGWQEFASADEVKAYDEKAKADRTKYSGMVDQFKPTGQDLFNGGNYKDQYLNDYDATAKRNRDKALRKGGGAYSQKDYQKDVDSYDREMANAADAYALATGAATRESLAFRDAQTQLSASLSAGKIGPMQYAAALAQLANAAKDGYASMQNLKAINLQNYMDTLPDWKPVFGKDGELDVKKSGFNTKAAAESHLRDSGLLTVDKGSATGHTTPDDPFGQTKQSADEATTKVGALEAAITKAGTTSGASGAQIAQAVGLVVPKLTEASSLTGEFGTKVIVTGGVATAAGFVMAAAMSAPLANISAAKTGLTDMDAALTKLNGKKVVVTVQVNKTGDGASTLDGAPSG